MASPVRLSLTILSLTTLGASAWGQATVPALDLAPPAVVSTAPAATSPATAPASEPAAPAGPVASPVVPSAPATRAETPAAATAPAAVTGPFVGTISADDVYVRSGPNKNYYDIGKLGKNDQVYIMGASQGWYQILPPNGAFCLISKKFVTLDPGNASGTVSGDDVRVRAGSATNPKDDSVVLVLLRKGTKIKILGTTTAASGDEYYQIAPPDRAYFFVSPQFIKPAAAGTPYAVPTIKLPAGTTGPSGAAGPSTPPGPIATIDLPPRETEVPTPGTIEPPATRAAGGATTPPPATDIAPIPTPVPAVTFSQTAAQKCNDLNAQYQEEMKKPLAQRNVDDLLKGYHDVLAMENISPSVKSTSDQQIHSLEQMAVLQKLSADSKTHDEQVKKELDALHDQQAAAERAMQAWQVSGGYVAQGLLKTSSVMQSKYALVDPSSGRVVAYVDPASPIDLTRLTGQYIGVSGTMTEGDVKLVKVVTATVMAPPAKP